MDICKRCSRPLHPDEVAITKKLINRGAREFFCADCLAAYFEVTRADIEERIVHFKAMGCTLFPENQPSIPQAEVNPHG